MKRRSFLNILALASAGFGLNQYTLAGVPERSKEKIFQNGSFSVDNNRMSYFLNGLTDPLKIIQITDTHLWMDDERGEPFKQYSQRMAKAYNTTKHFRTSEDTNPVNSFEDVLEMAVGVGFAGVVMLVIRPHGSQLLQPGVDIIQDARLIVVDEDPSGNVHG